MRCAIEAKATDRIRSHHLKGLKELKADYPEVARRVVVSLEPGSRVTEEGIEVLSVEDFTKLLWSDAIVL